VSIRGDFGNGGEGRSDAYKEVLKRKMNPWDMKHFFQYMLESGRKEMPLSAGLYPGKDMDIYLSNLTESELKELLDEYTSTPIGLAGGNYLVGLGVSAYLKYACLGRVCIEDHSAHAYIDTSNLVITTGASRINGYLSAEFSIPFITIEVEGTTVHLQDVSIKRHLSQTQKADAVEWYEILIRTLVRVIVSGLPGIDEVNLQDLESKRLFLKLNKKRDVKSKWHLWVDDLIRNMPPPGSHIGDGIQFVDTWKEVRHISVYEDSEGIILGACVEYLDDLKEDIVLIVLVKGHGDEYIVADKTSNIHQRYLLSKKLIQE